jgi:hypothetical protein
VFLGTGERSLEGLACLSGRNLLARRSHAETMLIRKGRMRVDDSARELITAVDSE